ncbi:SMC family ATPase [Streptomyces kaniharaensis]|uniref:Nuclease SbcCD subunit C n=1 Tax=Streptomyces kaniharaensis TaxID=212423 RepID=A0A6N7KXX6_9ACTN|nr:SMC family ATPase [Streptomyces kaniharaensis]MQS15108.1 SMC family ATPase [Streptomyces kaniharaensis]
MRLHRLTVTAFGPFAGSETVDFDALAAGGLFLLRGATGAGKSSVLDAVCFALYGDVPGSRRANRLRSDHADPHQLTEVRLELTLGGRRLQITRLPEQRRPKKVGSGTTVERPQTLLREWAADAGDGAPGWRGVSKSHQEAGEEIHRLIGMNREQFCQVVLLPQGDFARFLKADSEERGKLLRRLFDTERFQHVEAWLAEQRRVQEAAVQAGRRRLRDLASKAEQAAGPGAEPAGQWVPDEDESADLTAGVLGWAAILRAGAAEQQAVADAALAGAEAAHLAAQRDREAAEELAGRQHRHRQARQQADRLAEVEPVVERDRQRLAAAQAAVGVESPLRLREGAAEAHRRAQDAERRHREALARTGGEGQALATAGAAELAEAELRLRAEVVRLETARADERRCAELAREQRTTADDRRHAEELAEEAEDWLAEFEDQLNRLQKEQAGAQAASAKVEQLDGRRTELTARLGAARERDGLRAEIAAGEPRVHALRTAALDAREHSQDLRERRLAGMAAELAEQLRAGEACRVCGSPEHPAPAEAGPGGRVSAADEDRARAAQSSAEQAAANAEQALTALRVREATAAGAAGPDGADARTDALSGALAALEREHREARQAAEALGRVEQEIGRLSDDRARRLDERREARERAAVLTDRLQALDAEQRELTARVAAARGEAASVAERAADLTRLIDGVAAVAGAARVCQEAAARLSEAEDELGKAAAAAGFPDAEDALAVLLPREQREQLEDRLDRHRAELAAVRHELALPELAEAAARPAADLPAAQAALDAATARLRRAHAAQAAARERLESLTAIGRQLADLTAELAPALVRYGRINRLATLAAGTSTENRLRMRLESYVLAARLEQVAAAASDRLVRMSGGRYTLVHSDDRGTGNKRSGLALRVVDAWTGTERDTATLSGGESFFASLALALGLADVVTDEAGGMPLDTLFIDEGFGTLDEHSLEEVMDVLDGLRERDRAVGIVSHVADLRSRIPAQLLVRKGRHGSTLALAGREDA